jgi:hypothetical protein
MVKNEVRGDGLKHQKEKRSMDHFAGLDVSVKQTSICIVDDTGRIVREVKVASEPEALLKVLGNPVYRFKRIGLEADIARCSRHVANVPTTEVRYVQRMAAPRRSSCAANQIQIFERHFAFEAPPLTYINRVSRFYRPPYRAGWSGHISRRPSE